MSNLIFLDLYDNRIERINGLSNLLNLRVLMLGKNRISKIENLDNLVHLDVLDLHGNQVILLRQNKHILQWKNSTLFLVSILINLYFMPN